MEQLSNYDFVEARNEKYIHYLDSTEGADLYFIQCGYHHTSALYRYGPFIRDHYVIHFVQSGKGIFTINDKDYHLKAGHCFLIPPYQTTYYVSDAENPWYYMWLGFNGGKAENYLSYAGLSLENPVANFDTSSIMPLLQSMVDQVSISEKDQITRDLILGGELRKILALLIKSSSSIASAGDTLSHADDRALTARSSECYVNTTLQIIHHHYHEQLMVEDIAKELSINRSYLSSVFKEYTGHSVQKYLSIFRITKAMDKLQNTNLTIKEIASSVGFSDPRYFSRLFRKEKSITPKEYRARLQVNRQKND